MASNNIIGALQEKYASLGFTGKPADLYFDGIPTRDDAGAAVTLPTAEVEHHGTVPNITEEGIPFEQTTVVVIVHAVTLAEAAAIAWGIKYDTGTPTQFMGFDGAEEANSGIAFPLLRQVLISLVRTGEKVRKVASTRGPSASLVHRIELTYIVSTRVTG